MGWGYLLRSCLQGYPAALRTALSLIAATLALLAAPAQAQNSDSGTARTQVAVQEPGSILNVQDMNFGKIAQSSTAGTITLTPSGTAACTATGGLIRSGVCKAAEFSIYGKRNWKVRVKDVNGGTVTLNGPGGATMTMTNITIGVQGMSVAGGNGPPGWNLGTYNIDSGNGMATFYLGGRLNVKAAQTPGVYNGVVLVQVQFN